VKKSFQRAKGGLGNNPLRYDEFVKARIANYYWQDDISCATTTPKMLSQKFDREAPRGGFCKGFATCGGYRRKGRLTLPFLLDNLIDGM
ncbi:MAG: hypothetical protein ACE5I8_02885, partial [Thermodesulfobacteriota bacterium]